MEDKSVIGTRSSSRITEAENAEDNMDDGSQTQEKIQCQDSELTFKTQKGLQLHLQNSYNMTEIFDGSPTQKIQCPKCESTCATQEGLKQHLRNIHDITETNDGSPTQKKIQWQCPVCELTFTLQKNLKKHLQTIHKNIDTRMFDGFNTGTKCVHPGCEEQFYHRKKLYQHLEEVHKINLEKTNHSFKNEGEFFAWKEIEEAEQHVYFSKQTGATTRQSKKNVYYYCQRDGSSKPHRAKNMPGRLTDRRFGKGQAKTDLICPARMTVLFDLQNGNVDVDYIRTHSHKLTFKDTLRHPVPKFKLKELEVEQDFPADASTSGAGVEHMANEDDRNSAGTSQLEEACEFVNDKTEQQFLVIKQEGLPDLVLTGDDVGVASSLFVEAPKNDIGLADPSVVSAMTASATTVASNVLVSSCQSSAPRSDGLHQISSDMIPMEIEIVHATTDDTLQSMVEEVSVPFSVIQQWKDPKDHPSTPLLCDDGIVKQYQHPDNPKKNIFMCSECGTGIATKENMKRHQDRTHGVQWKNTEMGTGKKYSKCLHPGCEERFWFKKQLLKHVQDCHPDYGMEEYKFVFDSYEEFLNWKEKEEQEKFVFFSKNSTGGKNKDRTVQYSYYQCQKNGVFRPHRRKGETFITNRKSKRGTCKSDIVCPASLRVMACTDSMKYKVTYLPFHNHEISFKDTEHHPLPNRVRAKIKSQVLSGVPAKDIHQELCEWNFTGDGGYRRNREVSLRSIVEMKKKILKQDCRLEEVEEQPDDMELPVIDVSNLRWTRQQSPSHSASQQPQPSLKDTCSRAAASISSVQPVIKTEEVQASPKLKRPYLDDYNEDELAAAFIMPSIPFIQPSTPSPKKRIGQIPQETSIIGEIFESIPPYQIEVPDSPAQDVLVIPDTPLHDTISPLSWLLGKWTSDNGVGFYPRDFTYGEEAFFYHSGQPMLQLSMNSWHSLTRKPLHLETGFVRVNPGTNQVALVIAQNTGLTELSEGLYAGQRFTVESHTCGRLSFGQEPAVKKIKRTFFREGDNLSQIVFMETSTSPMRQHLQITYTKVE